MNWDLIDTWRFRQYKKFLWRSVVRLIYVSVGPIIETSTVIRMICKLEKQFLQSTLQDNYSSQII